MKAKTNRRNRNPMSSPDYRRFWLESNKVHLENSEYDKDGKGKAPNLKKINDFYKRQERNRRMRARG